MQYYLFVKLQYCRNRLSMKICGPFSCAIRLVDVRKILAWTTSPHQQLRVNPGFIRWLVPRWCLNIFWRTILDCLDMPILDHSNLRHTRKDTTKKVKTNGIESIHTVNRRVRKNCIGMFEQTFFFEVHWYKNWHTFPTRIETCTETNCDTILAHSVVYLVQLGRMTKRRDNVSIRSCIEDNILWMLRYNVSNVWIRPYDVSIGLESRLEVGISLCRYEMTHQ